MSVINLEYLHNAILKQDIDAIFDIMRHYPNAFVVEPVLKANPLMPSYQLEPVDYKNIMYSSRFIACVALYAFQVLSKNEDIGKLIYDIFMRHYLIERDIVENIVWFLQYGSDSRVDSVFAIYTDYISNQDNKEIKSELIIETLYKSSRPSWSQMVYIMFQKSFNELLDISLFSRISIEYLIYRRIEHIEVISKLCKDITFPSSDLVYELISFSKFTEDLSRSTYIAPQLHIALEYSNIRDYIQQCLETFNNCTENDLKQIFIYEENRNEHSNKIRQFETYYLNVIHEDTERKCLASETLETILPKDVVKYVVLEYLKCRESN